MDLGGNFIGKNYFKLSQFLYNLTYLKNKILYPLTVCYVQEQIK